MIETSATDNLVALLQQPNANAGIDTDISTNVVNTCQVTAFIAKEDIALTLGDLRKKSLQGKLWGGEKDRSLAGLHRRLTRYGFAKELGQQQQDGVRNEVHNNMGNVNTTNDDTVQTAISEALVESSQNIKSMLKEVQKTTKSVQTLQSSLKPSAFKI